MSPRAEENGSRLRGRRLLGRRVVITAGPTREHIDPVRYLSNASSGRMGAALARAALRAGARVAVVRGPCEAPMPRGARVIPVVSARQMRRRVLREYARADLVVAAAAVADWRPARAARAKLKKTGRPLRLTFVPNPDILAELGRRPRGRRPVLVGFALETGRWLERAREKLARKGADLIVANRAGAIGAARTRIALVDMGGRARVLAPMSKDGAARAILARAAELLEARA